MDKTFSDLIDYCRSNKRICPKETYWGYLYNFLPPDTNGKEPPDPWENCCPWEDYYNSVLDAEIDQQKLFLQHVEWAYHNGVFERCDRFLRSLIEEDRWIHVGEYTGGH